MEGLSALHALYVRGGNFRITHMDADLRKRYLEKIYRSFGQNKSWKPRNLTEPDPTDDIPLLNSTQAHSLFAELESKNLFLKRDTGFGGEFWILNEVNRKPWEDLINPPNWFQKNRLGILKILVAGFLWISAVAISAYLTKTVEDRVDEINEKISKWGIGDEEKEKGGTKNESN